MRTAADSPSSPVEVVQVVALTGAGGQFGGPTTVAVGLAEELARRGRAVTFISLREGEVIRPDVVPAGAWRTFRARRFVPGVGMLGLFNARLAIALWRALGRGSVAHVHAGRDLVSLAALVVARLRRTPVIAQTHGMVLPRSSRAARVFDAVFLRLLRRSSVVLYLTPSEESDLRAQLGPAARLRFLANGLTVPAVAGVPTRPPQVVFASRLHPVKRVTAFAEAARRLVRDGVDAEFVVYGPDQGDLPALLTLTGEPELRGRLRYGGALGHAETLAALSAARVFVLPSSADWMPMSLLEAMAAGVPSVCTRSCGLAPVIAEAEAGLVVEGEVGEIAAAVRRLLDDAPYAEEMGRRARALVRDRFAVTPVVDELEQLYAEAAGR